MANPVPFIICAVCLSIPWMVIFYMFGFKEGMQLFEGGDPTHCYITEGELWVSKTPLGTVNEVDFGPLWRSFYVWAFYVYIALTILPCCTGIWIMAMPIVGGVCAAISGIAKCVQCGLWFWALIGLRFSQEGQVAAGRMIVECEKANPDLVTVSNITDDATLALNSTNTTASEGRRLQEMMTDLDAMDLDAIMGGASCDDPTALQIKGGRLIFAWLVISFVCCK